jgi:hypothetical protein
MSQFTYEIVKPIAVISDSGTLSAELNIISYAGKEPKYDLRKWRTGKKGKKMQKGITLDRGELLALRDVLNGMGEI